MLVAACSVILFIFRFILLLKDDELRKRKWLKITPHVIDTVLFTLGIIMVIKLSLYPWYVDWINEKLFMVLAYIAAGYYTLKLAPNRISQLVGFIFAMVCITLIVTIAVNKQTYLF